MCADNKGAAFNFFHFNFHILFYNLNNYGTISTGLTITIVKPNLPVKKSPNTLSQHLLIVQIGLVMEYPVIIHFVVTFVAMPA